MNKILENLTPADASDRLRRTPFEGRMLIGGELVESGDGGSFDSVNPATEDVIGRVPAGTARDVERAVEAAGTAQPGWASLSVEQRAGYMRRFADALAARKSELLALEVADSGNTITGMTGDIASSIERIRYFAGLGHELQGRTIPGQVNRIQITLREPYGVVGRIAAFNHPFAMAVNGIAAPMVAGNTVIVKPSEQCSLSALLLGEIAREVLPPGTLSIVTGAGEVGQELVRHPAVKRLSFVGSVRTGMAIQRTAAEVAVKSIGLELGGKNPFIVYPDAPIEKVAEAAVAGMNFTWQGQSCSSTSRLFLHADIHDEVLRLVAEKATAIRVGDPFATTSQMGAMSTAAQLARTESFVQSALDEGAHLVTGGHRPEGAGFDRGFWFLPTVFADVRQGMQVAREEIFGPVLSVLKWRDEDEVIELANSVDLGLTGAVWSRDISQALRTASRLRSGYVWVNGVKSHTRAMPFGGYKNSGIGRERGLEELLSYTEEKSMQIFL